MRRALALLTALTFTACRSGGSGAPPLAAPGNVAVTAGDRQATVSWNPVPGALGYRVYEQDGAKVTLTSPAHDAGAGTSYSATGLINGHTYHFAVAANGAAGPGALSAEAVVTPAVRVPLAVLATLPADGATAVARNSSLTITFSDAVQPGSVTSSNRGAACTGTAQISSDGFASCAPLGNPVATQDNTVFTFTPPALLAGAATFRLKVTTGVKDAAGAPLAANYLGSGGFTTSAALAVTVTAPTGSNVPLLPQLSVSFNRPVLASTLSTTLSGTACAGSVNLSADNFATCAAMRSLKLTGQTAVLTLAAPLAGGTTYALRVSGTVQDADGVALGPDTAASFSTAPGLSVVATTPGAGAVDVLQAASLSVTFSAPAGAVTANLAGDTTCSGTLQLSADASATCVPMTAQPSASNGGKTFTFQPAAPLAPGTAYQLTVTRGVRDSTGVPLTAKVTVAFTSGPPFAVASTTPPDNAVGVSLLPTLSVIFNRAAWGATVNVGTTTCSGTVQLSADGFATCVSIAQAPVSGQAAISLTPDRPLASSTAYQLKVTPGVVDANHEPLAAPAVTTFTTVPPLAVTVAPADGATKVGLGARIVLSFNRPPLSGSVSAGGAPCLGSVQLSVGNVFAVCEPLGPPGGDGQTFTLTPVSLLSPNTTYFVRVTSAVKDADGVPLTPPFQDATGFTTGAQVDTTPPGPVSGVTTSAALQSVSLGWTNPADADFASVRLRSRRTGQGTWSAPAQTSLATYTFSALVPGTSYDFLLTTVDSSGNEQPPASSVLVTAACTPSGTAADWLPGETVIGRGLDQFALTWNESELFAGITNPAATGSPLTGSNGDALWIALDTDPDGDATGEASTPTRHAGSSSSVLIWPFKANYVISVQPAATPSTSALCAPSAGPIVCLHTSGTAGFSPLQGGAGVEGAYTEVRLPKASVGSPASVRVALAAVGTQAGYTFDLAPVNASGIDSLASLASATGSFGVRTAIFDPLRSQGFNSAPIEQAATLVDFSFGSFASTDTVTINGNFAPFNSGAPMGQYALPVDANGNVNGKFNLGGQAGELFFQIVKNGTPEFVNGQDRVFTLSGGADVLPELHPGVSAALPKTITFTANSCPADVTVVTGSTGEVGNWSGSSPAHTANGNGSCTVSVTFTEDFVASPLQFKLFGSSAAGWGSRYEPGNNHFMNDDILNYRTLTWSAGDGANF